MTNSITGNKHGPYILIGDLSSLKMTELYSINMSSVLLSSFRLLNKLFTGQSF